MTLSGNRARTLNGLPVAEVPEDYLYILASVAQTKMPTLALGKVRMFRENVL